MTTNEIVDDHATAANRKNPGASGLLVNRSFHALAFLLVLVVAVGLAVQPYPALQDFVEWIYQGWVLGELFTGNPAVEEAFALRGYPVPNVLAQILMGALATVVSPVAAAKIILVLYIFLFSVFSFLIARQVSPRHAGLLNLIILSTFCFGPGFWNGYINYQVSLLLFLVFCYFYILKDIRNPLFILVFSILIFSAHATLFAVFGLVVVVREMVPWRGLWPKRPAVFMAMVPSGVLLLWYLAIKIQEPGEAFGFDLSPLLWLMYKGYTLAKQGPFHNFILEDGSGLLEELGGVYWTGFAINILVALVLCTWFMTVLPRLRSLWQNQRAEVCIVAFLAALFVLMPPKLPGVVNFGERFLIPGLLVALVFRIVPDRRILLVWASACAACIPYFMAAAWYLGDRHVDTFRRSTATGSELMDYVDSLYAGTGHKYFNHRIYEFAARGAFVLNPDPGSMPDLEFGTSILEQRLR